MAWLVCWDGAPPHPSLQVGQCIRAAADGQGAARSLCWLRANGTPLVVLLRCLGWPENTFVLLNAWVGLLGSGRVRRGATLETSVQTRGELHARRLLRVQNWHEWHGNETPLIGMSLCSDEAAVQIEALQDRCKGPGEADRSPFTLHCLCMQNLRASERACLSSARSFHSWTRPGCSHHKEEQQPQPQPPWPFLPRSSPQKQILAR